MGTLKLASMVSSLTALLGNAGAAAQSAAMASGRSNAWKSRRRTVEWRLRWLEHRMREIRHQQRRYEAMLARGRHLTTLVAEPPQLAPPSLPVAAVPAGEAGPVSSGAAALTQSAEGGADATAGLPNGSIVLPQQVLFFRL